MLGKKLFSSAMVIAAVTLGGLVFSEPSQAATICTQQGGSVNLRRGPGQNYRVIISLRSGAFVEILGSVEGDDGFVWYRVSVRGRTGFIRGDFVCGDRSGDHN
jgi:uncharacterized protein YraI